MGRYDSLSNHLLSKLLIICAGVSFNTGLAIASKLQSYDDTDSAMATQSVLVGKGNEWDQDSDSWIP